MPKETPATTTDKATIDKVTTDKVITDKKALKPKKFFLKRPRFWVISFLVVLSLPFFAVAGVYFALKSSLVETYVWPKVQPIIAEQTGFHIELNQVRIDLLRSVYLKGIQVSQITDTANTAPKSIHCEGFNLTLDEIALDFSALDLLDKHLQINKLALTNFNATGCLLLDLNAKTAEVLEEETPPLDLNALLTQVTTLLDAPPITLNLNELSLNNFSVDVQIKERQQQLQASWQGTFDFFAKAAWQDNGIFTELNTQLTSSKPLQVAINQAPALQLDLTTQPNFNFNLLTELTKQQLNQQQLNQQPKAWQFKLAPAKMQFSLADTQLNLQQPEQAINLNLPSYNLDLTSEINLPNLLADTLKVNFELEQQLTDLNLVLNEGVDQQTFKLAKLNLRLNSHNQPDSQPNNKLGQKPANLADLTQTNLGNLLANLHLTIQQLDTAFSFQPIDIEQSLAVSLPQNLSSLELNATSQVDQLQLMELSLLLNNQPRKLSLQPKLLLNLPTHLASIFTEPSLKALPGDVQLALNATTRLNHSANNLLNADFEQLSGFVEQSLDLKISQQNPTTDLNLVQPLLIKFQGSSAFPELQPEVRLSLSSEALQHPPLLQPLPFQLDLATQLDKGFKALKLQLELLLDHQPLAKLDLEATDKPQVLNLTGLLDLSLNPNLEKFLADLQPLAEFGQLTLGQQFQLQLNHPENDALALAASDLDLNQLQAQLKHGLQLQHLPAKNAPVRLTKPLKLSQTLNWRATEASLKGHYNFAGLEVPEVLNAEALNLNLEVTAASGLAPEHLTWQLTTKAKQFTLHEALQLLEVPQALEISQLLPLHTQGDIHFNAASQALTIQQFSLQLGDWFKQQLNGEVALADLNKPSLQMTGNTYVAPQNYLAPFLDLTTSGSLNLPWQVIVENGEQLSLQAQVAFNDFSLAQKDLSLEGLQGIIAINEELRLSSDNKLSFLHLLTSEAFQRVDFNQIEPYLANSTGFTLTKVKLGDLEIGPLQATFNVKQNLIELPQFGLKLLAGDLAGQFYLDLTPKAWRLGLLSRITQLDLRQLLPKKVTSDYAPISARTALEFDFNQRLLAGRMDITDITRSQLLQLLELVDPEYLDPQINTVRSALRLAHPQWISAVMQNGLMDLTFSLSLFNEPLRAHGLPLSPIIERFGEEALLLPDQLPLE